MTEAPFGELAERDRVSPTLSLWSWHRPNNWSSTNRDEHPGVFNHIHTVDMPDPMCFIEIYLVYSEMFIPKISAGVLEESDRGSYTCPFNHAETISRA